MRTTRRTLTALTAAAVGGGLLGVPTTALAASSAPANPTPKVTCAPATFSQAQQALEQQLSARTTRLAALTGSVQGSSALTAADRTALEGILSSTTSGIAALTSKVPGDTTCAQLGQDARTMVQQYRVYAVVAPQTDLAIAADREASVIALVTSVEPGISSAISAAAQQGKDVAPAQAALSDLQSHLAAATTSSSGVAATVLAETPADFPASTNVFRSAHDGLVSARGDLQTVRTDLHTIVTSLT